MDVIITMTSGRSFDMEVKNGSIEEINKSLNRVKFVRFGTLVLNTNEIESIRQVAE